MFLHRIRLKVFALLIAMALTAIALVTLTTVPAWPVVGVAFAAFAMAVNQVASRLAQPVCYGCGADIRDVSPTAYGVICPKCGTLTQRLAELPPETRAPQDAASGREPAPASAENEPPRHA